MSFLKKLFGGSNSADQQLAERAVAAAEKAADAAAALAAAHTAETPEDAAISQWTSVDVTTNAEGGLVIRPGGNSYHISATEAKQYEGQSLLRLLQAVGSRAGVTDVQKLTSFMVDGKVVSSDTPVPVIPTKGQPVTVAASAPMGDLG